MDRKRPQNLECSADACYCPLTEGRAAPSAASGSSPVADRSSQCQVACSFAAPAVVPNALTGLSEFEADCPLFVAYCPLLFVLAAAEGLARAARFVACLEFQRCPARRIALQATLELQCAPGEASGLTMYAELVPHLCSVTELSHSQVMAHRCK